jgi:hypothetical protein
MMHVSRATGEPLEVRANGTGHLDSLHAFKR